jgi:hypothetical protein
MAPVSTPPYRPASPADQDARPAEPNAELPEVDEQVEMPLPSNLQTFLFGGPSALDSLAAIYVASGQPSGHSS